MVGGLWQRFETVARRRGRSPSLIQGDRRIDFEELHSTACNIAAALAQRGLGPGARCLVWAGNSPETAATILAVWRLGAIAVLVNDEAPFAHVVNAITITSPSVVAACDKAIVGADRLVDCTVLVLREGAVEPAADVPAMPVNDLEPASILFTSGSSGLPKGVVQSHGNLYAGCAMVAEHLKLNSDDRIICPIPWSFDYGYGQLLTTILLGVTQVIPQERNPFAICDAISAHRPTVFAGLPSLFALLLRGVSPLRDTDLRSLRLITNTGGKIAPTIFAEMLEVFGHCSISLNYGMTETYRSAGLPVECATELPDSVGFAYPGVSINVIRQDGREADSGEVGEIVHRGVGVFLGYWGDLEATAKVRRPDPLWCHSGLTPPMAVFSGDLGWKDSTGRLYVKGRRDRLIKSMGVRVSPDEVEMLIRKSGLVRDVAVVGLPHDMIGEMVVAAITIPAGADNPVFALKSFARREMSQHMQPREYHILESFPLTPNGKPDFAALRKLLADNAA